MAWSYTTVAATALAISALTRPCDGTRSAKRIRPRSIYPRSLRSSCLAITALALAHCAPTTPAPAPDVTSDVVSEVRTDAPSSDAPVMNDAPADGSGSEVVEMPADAGTDAAPTDAPSSDAGPLTFSAVELAVGLEWTCARTSAGEARCWGENTNGTLGDGTMTSRPLPAPAR